MKAAKKKERRERTQLPYPCLSNEGRREKEKGKKGTLSRYRRMKVTKKKTRKERKQEGIALH